MDSRSQSFDLSPSHFCILQRFGYGIYGQVTEGIFREHPPRVHPYAYNRDFSHNFRSSRGLNFQVIISFPTSLYRPSSTNSRLIPVLRFSVVVRIPRTLIPSGSSTRPI